MLCARRSGSPLAAGNSSNIHLLTHRRSCRVGWLAAVKLLISGRIFYFAGQRRRRVNKANGGGWDGMWVRMMMCYLIDVKCIRNALSQAARDRSIDGQSPQVLVLHLI